MFTDEEIMQVVCFKCNAKPGKPCFDKGIRLLGFHKERAELREKMPVFEIPSVLSSTDKAILTYYAFVMLADSCAANSEKLFGKVFTSQDIQRTFGRAALKAAQADGLIGAELTMNRQERRKAHKQKKLVIM